MIALIPGLEAALAFLPPQPPVTSSPQEGFTHILASASQNPSSSELPSVTPPRYEVQPGENLTVIAKKLGYSDPMVLARANGLKDPNRLQIGQVLTLPENTPIPQGRGLTKLARPQSKPSTTQSQAAAEVKPSPKRQLVVASWYGSPHHGKLMANGKPFNMYANTVAHKKIPLGTQLTITNPQNGASVEVRVTDRGPYISGRNLDLSYGVARKLGIVESGVAKLWMEES